MGKKILFTAIFFIVLLTTAFKFVEVLPKNGNSVIYVKRMDAILSMGHKVHVVLNGVDVAVIEKPDSYKAIHVKPGTYDIEFKIFNVKGERRKEIIVWTGAVESGNSYFSRLTFNFGWRSKKKFISQSKMRPGPNRLFAGEVDAINLVNPK